MKELAKQKLEANKVAAAKQAEADKKAIMEAIDKSGKSLEEILEYLK